jgi:hypothetical protein
MPTLKKIPRGTQETAEAGTKKRGRITSDEEIRSYAIPISHGGKLFGEWMWLYSGRCAQKPKILQREIIE